MNESNIIEIWGQNIVGKEERSLKKRIVLSPLQTEVDSMQEAIIQYTEYPFTLDPIILKNVQMSKPIEANKCLPSNRVMRTMVKAFNNPKNGDFKFKIKRQECEDPNDSCPSDDVNNGYDIIYCHKWFVEENCEHLRKMFANIKSINETEIKGYSYETYFHFIQYLYTDSIETKDIKLLNELLLLSDMYSEEELNTRCVSVIKPLINVENVSNFYCSAIINKSSDLEEYCFEFMTKNIKTIVKNQRLLTNGPKNCQKFSLKICGKTKVNQKVKQ